MITFIVRRLLASFFIVLGASFVVYMLMANAGDPLGFLVEITNPTQREALRRSLTESLSLDVHPVVRYFHWLGDVFHGDFGVSARTQLPVSDELASRVPLTLKLVSVATILSVVVGTATGVVTAIRRYSALDHVSTFVTFVFFSLPVFWVAVILKEVGGISFNDWLRDGARISAPVIVIFSLVAAAIASSVAGGDRSRRILIAASAGLLVAVILSYVSSTQWMLDPSLGPLVIAILAVGLAFAVTGVLAGIGNRRVLAAALTTAAVGYVVYFLLQPVFDSTSMDLWRLIGLGVLGIGVGLAVGWAIGGFDRGLAARTAAVTALLISVVIFVDRAMQSWAEYSSNPIIRNRPIKTVGDRESRLEGSFWVITNDTFSHLLLPTLALMLISLASYTRYSRASMLEVLDQDYMRTARAKGLSERTVVIRHGFRNAMIPLATIVAIDIGGVLGGAVITETVFEWNAMGRMFTTGLENLDPNPVMAFFVVIAGFAVIANLIADLLYAVLDPRIRITD